MNNKINGRGVNNVAGINDTESDNVLSNSSIGIGNRMRRTMQNTPTHTHTQSIYALHLN